MTSMRAVMIEPPEHLLAERRRLGLDRRDEVWDGVLHMPPMPSTRHQGLGAKLVATLMPLAERRGWNLFDEIGLYRRDDDYRGPDVAIADPKDVTERGLEGHAELVIEILSPADESRDKLPFYAKCGVPEPRATGG
jgi:Uma2 family endonuclease